MSGDPHRGLVRLLGARAGADAILVRDSAASWRSLLYAGTKHRLIFALPAAQADRFAGLEADMLPLPGHLVVECVEIGRAAEGAVTIVELAATTVERG